MLGTRSQYHAAGSAPRQGRYRDVAAHRGGRRREIIRLVKRADLGFVGDEDSDIAVDEIAKGRAMPPDAERVGKAQRHLAPGGMSDRGGFAEGFLRLRRVEKEAFEIGDLGGRDD